MKLYKADESLSWWFAWLVGLSVVWGLIFGILMAQFGIIILSSVGIIGSVTFFCLTGMMGAVAIGFAVPRIAKRR